MYGLVCNYRSVVRDHDTSNIGRGVGSRLWIVEQADHNHLAPIGCMGELVIEGPVLARGYFEDGEKTKAAFIDNVPWLPEEPSRIYKTGDLARYDSDGTVQFLGRRDTQVKLRGQRLELGEVEHT